ncbi:Imidazole glycerol phosphate synthase amidotransferase subunit [hydrothermal vent metagenome]|uniref:Imidazole glycerol phosphate synthase amidotransferase subunit n=1 Tax=hydrothermal vent metagenome TaxID=652676 RepID=A0A3B0YRS8_9ZZZZ
MGNIVVIDYGMGNLRSVSKALEHVTDQKVLVSSDAKEILKADRVVFPGQGAMGAAMQHMRERDLVEVVHQVSREKPFLGICLGLQALMTHSAEDGGVDGLNVIPGQVLHFDYLFKQQAVDASSLKIPHMGWNHVQQSSSHPLWENIENNSRFYFVHSYYIKPDLADEVTATTNYGAEFTSAAGADNWFAVQFHPEKSQQSGLQLLKNFVHWNV